MATTTETREREIVDLETRFWNAMKAKDPREASQLTDDGCVVVGAQGVSSVDRRISVHEDRTGFLRIA